MLVLTPIFYWTIIESQEAHELEPSMIHFFHFTELLSNETFMDVWNKTKDLDVTAEFSRNTDYSVLVYAHYYACGGFSGAEWFVVASTLEPDSEGNIHELVLRLDYENSTLIKPYLQTHSFNLTSVENGTRIIEDFMAQDPYQYWSNPREENFHVNYPFLILFIFPIDYGITVVLNLNTGKVMIAATSVWMGYGYLVYPEKIYDVGS
ncbi:MAG: hypothetical protein OEZ40_03985 [Candidatus Bathyarchaeota archaeon]|nr:hypothetical protein [Candidatus Bathyarchaeota archaeon]